MERRRRGRVWRRVLLALVGLTVLLAVGAVLLTQTQAFRDRALTWAQRFLSDGLGREVRIQAIKLKPWLGKVELAAVQIAALPGEPGPALFAADTIHARWDWIAILRRQVDLRYVQIERPRLALAATGGPELPAQGLVPILLQGRPLSAGGWTLHLRQATVREGRLLWRGADDVGGVLEGVDGELTWQRTPEGMATAAASLQALRLEVARGDARRTFDIIRLRLGARPGLLTVQELEFRTEGAVVRARGRVQDLAGSSRLGLDVAVRSPLPPVLQILGLRRPIDGRLTLDGRIEGPWAQPVFGGEGLLEPQLGKAAVPPIRFALRWDGQQVELDLLEAAKAKGRPLGTRFGFTPETGAFQVQAQLAETDLQALSGLPAVLAALGGLSIPSEVRGRISADVDLSGVGADVASLRGRAVVRAEGLALEGETPSGRLEARLIADAKGVVIPAFTLRIPGGEIEGRGRVGVEDRVLDLPVRADLQRVASVARGFGVTTLDGRATLAGRVGGTLDAPQFRGRIAWQEARIDGRAVDAIEGDVQVGPRRLAMERLTVRAGRSRLTLKGSVEAQGSAPLRSLDVQRHLLLDLQAQIGPGQVADLLALLPPDQAKDIEIQGGLQASGRVAGTVERLSGSVDLALDGARTGKESWDRIEAQIQLRDGAVNVPRLLLRRGRERVSGAVQMAADGKLGGHLASGPVDLARVGYLSKTGLGGRATFQFELGGTTSRAWLEGKATSSSASFKGIALGAASAAFRVEGNAVSLDLICLEETHRFQATISPPPNSLLEGQITVTEGDLDSLLRLGKVEELRQWRPTGSGWVRLREKPEDSGSFRGEIEFAALQLRQGDEVWESAEPVRARFDEPAFTVSPARLKSGEHELGIRGEGGAAGIDLALKGTLPFVALTPYIDVGRALDGLADVDLRIHGPRGAIEVTGPLSVQKGRFLLEGFATEFQEVQARVSLDGARTRFQDVQARLADGLFRGSGEVQSAKGRWDLRFDIQEERGQVRQLLAGIYRGRGEVTGDLSLRGTLTSGGEARGDFWANLGGTLKLEMHGGRIGRYTALAKILSIMHLGHLLGGSADLSARGMPYKSLTADIAITQGVARTENLILESPAMKLTAVGSVNLAEETVDMAVAVRPFQNLDLVVTSIPVAGWLLGGKEKSLLVAYFTVTGPLGDPDVTAAPLKSMGRNVFGIFANILGIPKALGQAFENSEPQAVKPHEGSR